MGETKREKRQLVGDSQIFAELVLGLQGKWFGAEENCSKPQEIAGSSFDPFLPFSLSH